MATRPAFDGVIADFERQRFAICLPANDVLTAQPIKAAAISAFRIERVVGKGRTIETHGESAIGRSRTHPQLSRCKPHMLLEQR